MRPGLPALAQALQAIGDVDHRRAVRESEREEALHRHDRSDLSRGPHACRTDCAAIGLTATPASTMQHRDQNIVNPQPDLVVVGHQLAATTLAYSDVSDRAPSAARARPRCTACPRLRRRWPKPARPRDYVAAAQQVLGVARRVKDARLPPNTFLNVNMPAVPAGGYKGYMVTTQAPMRGGDESFVGDEASVGTDDLLERVPRRRHRAAGHRYLGRRERLRVGHADARRRDDDAEAGSIATLACARLASDRRVRRCVPVRRALVRIGDAQQRRLVEHPCP